MQVHLQNIQFKFIISKSSDQDQGHISKKAYTSVTIYTHSRMVVRLRLKGNLVNT